MYTLKVNGKEYVSPVDKSLMQFLRQDLKLKSVKDGCSEGACGTCTILIDGKPVKSCVKKLSKLEGAEIVTVEGLSDREKEVYTYAYSRAGAVQCGFCIPGMVICTKALLDTNPNPTRKEAAFAIRNNICRCTGYQKIIDAMMLSAAMLRGEADKQDYEGQVVVGSDIDRIDVVEKILGVGEFVDDVEVDNLVYGSAVRSKFPRALVKSIDTTKAEQVDGVIRVITAKDIPGNKKIGHLKKDWDALIDVGEITRYLGDAICLVVAETQEALAAGKEAVEIEFEELTPMTCPQEALAEGAPLIHEDGNVLSHEHLVRGNAEEAIQKSAYVVTKHYETPFTEHAFLEPETAIAMPYKDGLYIYSSDQSTYDTQHECAELVGLDNEKVVVVNKFVGGGFGGKEDMSVQHHAALIAYLIQRPVKVKLTRKESILVHPKRHAMSMDFTLACDESGYFTGMIAKIVADTGAYASLGGPVLQRACTHASGPYDYQNIDIDGKAIYTNNPPGGAFRGFGVTQSCFALESNINLLAEKVGISPWEIRYRNAIRPGRQLPNGQIASPETGLVETLMAVKEIYDKNPKTGIACALKNAGIGVGIPDTGRCKLVVQDGRVHLYSAATCMGQGLATVFYQILAETIAVEADQIIYHRPNTENAPNSGVSSASRQTLVSGEAVRRAGRKLAQAMESKSLEELNGQEFHGEYVVVTDRLGADKPSPVSHVAYGYATHVCVLNEDGTIQKMIAAHNVGKAVNPRAVEGQIEGGVVMSMGYALTEDYPLDQCKPTARYGTLGLFKADKVPQIDSIIIEKKGLQYAYGAIGIGEITSIPTAPAIQLAYYNYDGNFRTRLPLENTPYSRKK